MADGGGNGGARRELFPAAGRDRGSSSGVSPKLRIDNLHYEVSERELSVRRSPQAASSLTLRQALFTQIGPLEVEPAINVRHRFGRATPSRPQVVFAAS